jgi:two-component system, NtrC family, response regulator GlrR
MQSSGSRRPTVSLGFGIVQPRTGGGETAAKSDTGVRKAKILVIEQDAGLRRSMTSRLSLAQYTVEAVGDAQSAIDYAGVLRPDLAILDLPLRDADGLEFLKKLKSRWPQSSVIIVTAHGSIPEAVKATQSGAFSYLVKPVTKEELLGHVSRAVAGSLGSTSDAWRANIAARSQLTQDRLAIANRAAGSDDPILLIGGQGSGTELLARAIHAASARRTSSFVAFTCPRQPSKSFESALFGKEACASGESSQAQPGAWQQAHAGTLLIDGIDDMPLAVQATLLTALTNGRAPGDNGPSPSATVRLICTSSQELEPMVESGRFLEGLHGRISTISIETPPLGRRREDIPLLISNFLEQAIEPGSQNRLYSPQAIELLATSDWPGHVRQLFDLVKRNVALSGGGGGGGGGLMTDNFARDHSSTRPNAIPSYEEARENFARDYLKESLKRAAGNVTKAARLAKRGRTDFYKLLARHRLDPCSFKGASADMTGGEAEDG